MIGGRGWTRSPGGIEAEFDASTSDVPLSGRIPISGARWATGFAEGSPEARAGGL